MRQEELNIILKQKLAEFSKTYFSVEEPATELPKYPDDVSAIDDGTLSGVYSLFMGWNGYLHYLISLREFEDLVVKQIMGEYKTAFVTSFEGKKTECKAALDHDPDYGVMCSTLLTIQQEITLFTGKQKYLDACSKALSREMSRRISENQKLKIG